MAEYTGSLAPFIAEHEFRSRYWWPRLKCLID